MEQWFRAAFEMRGQITHTYFLNAMLFWEKKRIEAKSELNKSLYGMTYFDLA